MLKTIIIVVSAGLLCSCILSWADAPVPIHESGFVTIGGIEQWVTIRGDDVANPVLLHIHGGPGKTWSAFTDEFKPFEKDFTMVQWDQRGSGRTFARYREATPDLTFDRLIRDGIELAKYLQKHQHKKKIILFGHSLGSIVAAEMARRTPELFSVYVGTGQVASFKGTIEAQLSYLRKKAEAANDNNLITRLDEIEAVNPPGLQQFFAINRILFKNVPADDAFWYQRIQTLAPKVMTPEELADWNAGAQFSVTALMPEVPQKDLFKSVPQLEIPVVVIQGSEDIYAPVQQAIAWFKYVKAPKKELIIIKGAAHFSFLTHTKEFLAALVDKVRPLALEGDARK